MPEPEFDWKARVASVHYMAHSLCCLKSLGFNPAATLDIGAHEGHFAALARAVWPDTKVALVDACREWAEMHKARGEESYCEVLGYCSEPRCFYRTALDPLCGMNSLYRDLTAPFADAHLVREVREGKRLDDLFRDRTFDLLKLDVQGAELDVLYGGSRILAHARVVILEMSLLSCNDGAPLADEVIAFLRERDWLIYDLLGPHHGAHYWYGRRAQVDGVFIRSDDRAWLEVPAATPGPEVDEFYKLRFSQ
jgi:FkbM family methyltransferase